MERYRLVHLYLALYVQDGRTPIARLVDIHRKLSVESCSSDHYNSPLQDPDDVRPYVKIFGPGNNFSVMSVIFLTSRTDIAEAVTSQRLPAEFIADGKALLLTKAALNPTTMQAVYRDESWDHIKDPAFPRSILDIGDGYFLRVVHDSKVMGPTPGFLNVGYGDYTCPWGIWTLFKGDPTAGQCSTISKEEAEEAYYKARSYTHKYTPHNEKTARFMNYL